MYFAVLGIIRGVAQSDITGVVLVFVGAELALIAFFLLGLFDRLAARLITGFYLTFFLSGFIHVSGYGTLLRRRSKPVQQWITRDRLRAIWEVMVVTY